jgi:hypothetical protein
MNESVNSEFDDKMFHPKSSPRDGLALRNEMKPRTAGGRAKFTLLFHCEQIRREFEGLTNRKFGA